MAPVLLAFPQPLTAHIMAHPEAILPITIREVVGGEGEGIMGMPPYSFRFFHTNNH